MHKTVEIGEAIAGLAVGITTSALATGAAKLRAIHREVVETMPKEDRQEIRVLFARLEPGDRTPYHSHRFPVTVYVLEGAFTLELDEREPVTIRAGEVFVEPSHVRMTGRNLDAANATTMVLFYVSDPDTPFADPAK
jgi:quercetin dioxygenase-like cupin family protein